MPTLGGGEDGDIEGALLGAYSQESTYLDRTYFSMNIRALKLYKACSAQGTCSKQDFVIP